MDVHISLRGRGDLSARIYRQLFDAVQDGRLRPDARLPATRALARHLAVARNTVLVAYERLAAEGVLVTRVGGGTFVCAAPAPQRPRSPAPSGAGLRPRPIWEAIGSLRRVGPERPQYDFRVGRSDARLFPMATWRRLVAREWRDSSAGASSYGDPAGHAGLRAAIARHVGVSRAVRATADDVVVTSGGQQALDLIARVLIAPDSCVAMEEPGYLPARRLFQTYGARVAGVPVDDQGIVVDAIPRRARLVYVTPSHQFPLGTPMSLARRAALLSWADRRGGVVIEDDYDSEFRFGGRPLDPIQSLDRTGRVIYVGSFSKVMLPILRLGFVIAPAALQPALRTAKQLADWSSDGPSQAALARFIDQGLLARHIRKAAREYAARHALISASLARDFGPWLRVVPSVAGMHLATRTAPGSAVRIDAVLARANRAGVAVHDLSSFCGDDAREHQGLVLGYGGIPSDQVAEGLARLRACFRGM